MRHWARSVDRNRRSGLRGFGVLLLMFTCACSLGDGDLVGHWQILDDTRDSLPQAWRDQPSFVDLGADGHFRATGLPLPLLSSPVRRCSGEGDWSREKQDAGLIHLRLLNSPDCRELVPYGLQVSARRYVAGPQLIVDLSDTGAAVYTRR